VKVFGKVWVILDMMASVACLGGGRGWLIVPEGETRKSKNIRWVSADNDFDFEIERC